MSSNALILVVEDDPDLRDAISETLRLAGYDTASAGSGAEAVKFLARHRPAAVLTDVRMDDMDGEELLRTLTERGLGLPVILMTAYGTVERAVAAMRQGAADYLLKPVEGRVLVETVKRVVADVPDSAEPVAVDPRSRELLELAQRVAASEVSVTLTGESGTGKEVFARFIHHHSARADGPFIAINCAAIPENMLEATLFGYEKGAFTGAYQARPGKFEQACGGSLLLDEISEMDLGLQAKLLRVLQEREVERLGARRTIELDVRVLATSNRNLREEVAAGRFREDLFYRLNVFPLHLPPLRKRPGDIAALARRLLVRHADARVSLSETALARLAEHSWPGNVRELDNVIQRALILRAGDVIDAAAVCFESPEEGASIPAPAAPAVAPVTAESGSPRLERDLRSHEGQLILDALRAGRGSRKAAAERLGISPRTLRYKLARLREAGVAIPT